MAVELQQMHSVNPATEERIGTYPVHSERDVDAQLDAAAAAAPGWRATTISDRCAVVARVGELLLERRDALAALITAEMGKTLTEARAEVEQ